MDPSNRYAAVSWAAMEPPSSLHGAPFAQAEYAYIRSWLQRHFATS